MSERQVATQMAPAPGSRGSAAFLHASSPPAVGAIAERVLVGRMPHLDVIRGLAALAVCLGHLRGFFIADYSDVGGGLAAQLVYAATGLSHQAVMIFFVLSGFLVGGSVIRAHQSGKWSWVQYLLRRLCRLWIVILPALFLTLFWDALGAQMNPSAYRGAYYPLVMSGPSGTYDLSAGAFIGNLFFLQTIYVPSFGSNGPLWSLANEFWYYLLFPALLQIVSARSIALRLVAIVLAVAIVALLPRAILFAGLIWLFGAAAFLAFDRPSVARIVASLPFGIAASLAFLAALATSRNAHGFIPDLVTGLTFAAALPWLARARSHASRYERTGFAMSEISYTLYLVHFPFLAWIYFTFAAPAQQVVDMRSIGMMGAVLAVVIAYAVAVWWLFERNTDRVRRWVARRLGLMPPGAGRA